MKRALATLLCCLSLSLSAQETPRLGETVDVSIVNVDVVVTDRKGNRVHGLSKDDFEILENGTPKQLSNFAEYAADGPEARVGVTGDAQPNATREKRTFLIFFEKMQLTGFAADAITESLKKTVAQMIQPGDSVSIVYWSRHEIEHFDAGDDPAAISSAIDFLNRKAKTIRIDEREQFLVDQALKRAMLQDYEVAPEPEPGIGQLTGSRAAANDYVLRAYTDMTRRVAAINGAINSIAGIDGRKFLLLATYRLGEVAGAEYALSQGAQMVPSHLRSLYGTGSLMQSITDNANAAGITIYPVYPPGIESNGATGDYLTLSNEMRSLAKIAEKTGGVSAAGHQKVAELLPQIAADASNYYSLAYRVQSDGTDRARDVAVKARNPEYVVRARQQFVEKSDETRMRDRLKATLFHANEDTDIDIAVLTGKAKKSRRTYTVPVEVKIPVSQLTMLQQGAGKHGGSFSVYVGVATELNQLSDVTLKTQPYVVTAAQMEKALASHFTYEMDVEVNGASKYLAVGVFDEVGRTYGLQRVELEQTK